MSKLNRRVRTLDLAAMKERGEKIVMITCYDASMAGWFEDAGVDVFLVGDSLGTVIQGHETTIPVTLEAMIHHTRAVSSAAQQALVIADMPFLTYQVSTAEAVANAGKLMQQGGAHAVKLEGGRAVAGTFQTIVDAGIPVMGHLGLTPQAVHQLGGYRRQALTDEAARALIDEARMLEAAGAFSLVVECIPDEVARAVSEALSIPIIGIGSGPYCDGQVLVSYDLLGLTRGPVPPFAKQYAKLGELAARAVAGYVKEVRQGAFPEAKVAKR